MLLLGHNYISTEHFLLSLICEGDGVAALVPVKLGAEQNPIRQQVIQPAAAARSLSGDGEALLP